MYSNDTIAVTDKKKADLFNSFFQSVFTTTHYKRNQKESIAKIDKIHFTRAEVEKTLEKLCIGKTKGPDGLRSLPLKRLTKGPSLTFLFNLIANKHIYPSRWKASNIIPLFKDRNKQEISNYRLVSLLTNLKMLFKFVIIIIRQEQHGFTKKKSTMTDHPLPIRTF